MKPARLALLLALATGAPAAAQNPAVAIDVDASQDRLPIDPRIYGLNYADPAQLDDLNCPLNRRGGNNTSRYNWQANADNRGSDWYFESIAYGGAAAGGDADAFVGATLGAGAEPMITLPLVGWVAKLGSNRSKLASFSIAKYGPQTGNDAQWFPDAGNGISSATGQPIAGNDPGDANLAAGSTFQQGWVQHLVDTWGTAASGGVRYYVLDNEHSIWHATHRDVHPTGATMDEIRDKMADYGAKVKAVDPGAVVVGPEEWGWGGYFWSGYDQQWYDENGWGSLPDREAHGNWDYLPWLLDQMRQREVATGQRPLDVFTVHYYPQGGEFSSNTSTSMQLRRNRSTRSLWDPAYVDETWINDTVRLVPRLREWVATYYPGTLTGITEYNWGAESHINGATAQADILGIFGREGLDMATRWTTPAASTPTYKAMKMYRNYDGQKSTFGDVSVFAAGPNPDQVAVFAAERTSDGALTIMVVSKALSGNTPAAIDLAGFVPSGPAQVWQLTSANVIDRLADVAVSGASLSATLPPQSVTLFVLPSAPTLSVSDLTVPEPGTGSAPAVFAVTLSGEAEGTVTVGYATANGTAAAGSDYASTSGTLTFAPGVTSRTVGVAILGDGIAEPTETFRLQLSGAVGATIADGEATASIIDSGAVPKVQFSSGAYTVSEGASRAVVSVKRLVSTAGTVEVGYATSDGSAASGLDYGAASGTLTFAPGVATRTLSIPVLPDTLVEGPETVLLRLGGPTGGAALGPQATAVLTITDNDPPGILAFSTTAYRVVRAAGSATIAVKRTSGSSGTVTVAYATSNGSATAGADYQTASGVLTFTPGTTSRTFAVTLLDDGTPTADETVNLTLSSPTGGAILGKASTAVLTLATNDPVLQFSAARYTVGERGVRAIVSVKRSGPTGLPVTVDFATSPGTAAAGSDYTTTAGTLSFPAGVVTRTLAVPVIDDPVVERDETVLLALQNPGGGAALGPRNTAVLTIKTDEPAVQFSAASYKVSETATKVTIAVKRSGPAGDTVNVSYAASNGSATAGTDYTATSGTLTFAPGVLTRTFSVSLLRDSVHEGAETVNLALSAPSAGLALGATDAAVLTITDNDAAGTVQFSVTAYSVSESAAVAMVKVARSGGLGAGMTVQYATQDGTAVAGTHYQTVSGTFTFAAGEAGQTFEVPILDDLVPGGPNRTVILRLSDPAGGAVLGPRSTATLWIVGNP